VMQLFPPSPSLEPILTGGQFFALLRLVLHARSGAKVDRNLVFVQGEYFSYDCLSALLFWIWTFSLPCSEMVVHHWSQSLQTVYGIRTMRLQ